MKVANLKSVILLILSFFSFIQFGSSAHIVGGDMSYECRGLDTLANGEVRINLGIELIVYRDSESGGAEFDNPARIGIYRFDGVNYVFIAAREEVLDLSQAVPLDSDNPCVIYPPDVGVERGIYRFNLPSLPILTGNQRYAVVYQRCCRNETITNLVSPGNTGAAYMIEITSQAMEICNDSPTFNNFPPVVICSGEELNFDHSASDNQGHQIFYEFCAPLTAGGTDGATTPGNANDCTGVTPDPQNCRPPFNEVTFLQPNFSFSNPMAGVPQVSINPITGLITGTPLINGQYVVGVCAREVLNGTVMTVLRRDFQFNVTTCEVAVTANIDPQGDVEIKQIEEIENGQVVLTDAIVSCGDRSIEFTHRGDTKDIESYYWEAFVPGVNPTGDQQTVTFDFPDIGTYGVLLITNQGLSCEAKDSFPVVIYPGIFPDFQFDYDTCVAGDVIYEDLTTLETTDQTIEDWNWNFSGFDSSADQDPAYEFPEPGNLPVTLTITDNNNCRESIIQDVNWFPAPPILVIEPSVFVGCAPAEIFFNNLSSPIDSTYTINWDFGDGETGDEISPTHIYEETGIYSVSLEVISPIGCRISDSFNSLITVKDKPRADFTFTPEEPNVFNTTVDFTDNSQDAVGWLWYFGEESIRFEQNPTYTFQDTGVYLVSLIVRHESGCTDTITKPIDIEPIVTFHMPNAFTPNGDATNDILIGKGFVDGLSDFRYSIWNRWGEKIFETDDPYQGWNGTKNNNGQNSPSGVYVYDVHYVDPRGKKQHLRGHATLIR